MRKDNVGSKGLKFCFLLILSSLEVPFLLQFSRSECVKNGFLFSRHTSPDFLYVRSWLPCIFFSGGVTVGNIGRQLAMVIFIYLN